MKNIKQKLIGFFVAALLPFAMAGTANAGLNDGLVGYWTFDEGIGIVANDVSGSANAGAINGGATYGPGKSGTALSFDGVNAYVNVADSASLDATGAFSIGAWVKPDAASLAGNVGIVSKDSSLRAYTIMLQNGKVDGYFSVDGSAFSGDVVGSTTLTPGVWSHIAVTRSGSTLKVFVNGVLDGQTTGASASAIFVTSEPVLIGARKVGVGYFTGGIDEVKIYNRALADCEVDHLADGNAACLLPATFSPSKQYANIDPNLDQDIVVDNQHPTNIPGIGNPSSVNGTVGMAWLANGHMIRRLHNVIVEYSLDQTRTVHATPVLDIVAVHTVSGLAGNGHGITMGLNGKVYANSTTGLYEVDPSTWTAIKVGNNGYWYGIGTLPDGKIVNVNRYTSGPWWASVIKSDVFVYDPVTGIQSLIRTTDFVDDLTTTSTGVIALAMRFNQRVDLIDASGTLINSAVVKGLGSGQPDGMAFGSGAVFVAVTDGSISRIDFSGPNFSGTATETTVASAGTYGDLASVGPDGAFYISVSGLNYDDGTTAGGWGVVRISKAGGFSTPPGVPSNQPPVANAGAAQTIESTGSTTAVTLNGSTSSDPDSDPLTYAWSWAGGSATGVTPTVNLSNGSYNITLTVDDGNAHTATATTSVTVSDTIAPSISIAPIPVTEATSATGTAVNVASYVTATDVCAVSLNVSPAGTYGLGNTTVLVTATDCENNQSSASTTVTVVDTTAPVLSVPANVSIEANAVLSTVALGTASATDIFGATVVNDAPAAGFPLGTSTVTYTATDGNGLTTTGTQTVTVVDTTAPVLSVPANVSIEANAVLSTVALGTATATDIFGATVANDAPAAGFPLGATTVIYTATDGNGLTTTGTQTVTVADTTAPVLSVPANVSIEANAVLSTVNLGTASATDIFGANVTNDAPATFGLGTTTVTYTATDGNGLQTVGTQTVTVADTTAPVLSVPADVSIEANGVLSTVALGTASATDIFGANVTNDAPATFALGTTTVTYTATDGNGLQTVGTQTVTVADTTAPVLSVPANVSIEANGVLSTVALGTASATDIFGATVANDAPATFALGATTVTYTATDGNGLTSTGTQTVTVADTTAPVLTLPADVSVEANAVLSTVAIGSATATDIFAVTVTSDAPASYALGTTVVTWTATDANGNASSGTQNVTVSDTTAPVLTVPADVSVEANAVLSTVAIGSATATDIFAVTVTSDAPATYALGTTVVTWTATDANGNVTSGTQNVTVVDTTAPVLTVPADVTVEANGVLSTVAIGTASATDIFGATVSNNAPASYALGTTVVTWTATDGNGLITIGTQSVTVVDTTAPTVTAQLIPVALGDDDDEHGKGMFKVVFSAADIADPNPALTAVLNGATVTNGQIVKLEQDDDAETEFEHGQLEVKGMSFTLTATATDASGNVGTAAAAYAFPVKHKKHEAKKDKSSHDKKGKKSKKSRKHKKHDKDD